MNWKTLDNIQGIQSLKQLVLHLRVTLQLPGAPPNFEIKVFEHASGGFEALASHLPIPKPAPRAGLASRSALAAARPAAVSPKLGAKPTARPAPPFRARASRHPSSDLALEQTLRALMAQAGKAAAVEWSVNPEF